MQVQRVEFLQRHGAHLAFDDLQRQKVSSTVQHERAVRYCRTVNDVQRRVFDAVGRRSSGAANELLQRRKAVTGTDVGAGGNAYAAMHVHIQNVAFVNVRRRQRVGAGNRDAILRRPRRRQSWHTVEKHVRVKVVNHALNKQASTRAVDVGRVQPTTHYCASDVVCVRNAARKRPHALLRDFVFFRVAGQRQRRRRGRGYWRHTSTCRQRLSKKHRLTAHGLVCWLLIIACI